MYKLLTLALMLFVGPLHAACPDLYPAQRQIAPPTPSILELCNSFYVSQFNTQHSKVVFVSERLLPGTSIGAPTRLSGFRSDPRVRSGPSTTMYEGTGFDRGHLVPAENASTNEQMRDTFIMTNVVPQNPTLNRGEWKKLESMIRKSIMQSRNTDPVYVVTIPVYTVQSELIADKIPIPVGIWKVVIQGTSERYFFAGNSALATVFEHKQIDWRTIIHTQSLLHHR